MEIIQTKDPAEFEGALSVARSLHGYFTERGYADMARDFQVQDVYIAREDGQILGFASLQRKNAAVAEICWLAVREDRQRCGIGALIVETAVEALRRQGFRLLEVKTLASHVDYEPFVRTHRFYKKLGFHSLEVIDPYPGWEPDCPCEIYVRVI